MTTPTHDTYLSGGREWHKLDCAACNIEKGRACHYCGTVKAEMRPYGPGGSWVCHPCATSTPERSERTEAAFGALLDGNTALSPTGLVAIGEQNGPRPFDPAEAS